MVVLGARDRQCVEFVAKATQTVVVVAWQRLFEPAHAHSLQLASDSQSDRKTPHAMAAVAGLYARLVGVDHDVDAVADGRTNGFDDLEVLARVGRVKTKLDRGGARPAGWVQVLARTSR